MYYYIYHLLYQFIILSFYQRLRYKT